MIEKAVKIKNYNDNKTVNGKSRLKQDALARRLGIKIVELLPGYAVTSMRVVPELLNYFGVAHGGAVFCLADVALAAASNSHGPVALALSMNMQFLKTTTEGIVLTATAKEEYLTEETGLYRVEVKDENGEIVALVEGLVFRWSSNSST